MAKRGRKKRPYETSWGEVVPGLTRCADGRWRIAATEERFTEADEQRAVAKFRTWERSQATDKVSISVASTSFKDDAAFFNALTAGGVGIGCNSDLNSTLTAELPEAVLWIWLKEQLVTRPAWVAERVGIPELAGLASYNLPKPPIPIHKVVVAYRKHSHAEERSKDQAIMPFMTFVEFAKAKTLDDFTDQKLMEFREIIVERYKDGSSDTVKAYFARIRTVIRLAGRELDAVQMNPVWERCRAKLYPPPCNVVDDPHPISREDFHKLLAGAEGTKVAVMWRAMLLLALNCLFYMEDLLALRWTKIDLVKGCIVKRRRKKGRCLQVSVLWPVTVEALHALRALPKRGDSPFVFTSSHGTRYNRQTKGNDFADLREKSEVTDVTFSHLRDGGYTAAYKSLGVDAKLVELLAGHATGMKDKYVLRTPEMVKPATNAIYEAYFGSTSEGMTLSN